MSIKEKKEELRDKLRDKLRAKIQTKKVGRMSKNLREKTVEDIYKKIGVSESDMKALTDLSKTITTAKQK